MIKKLSRLMFLELEIEKKFAGKAYAFTPVMKGSFIGLGIAVANEPGYSPVPMTFCHGDNHAEMEAHAEEANREFLGHSEDTAMTIVCSSYAAGRIAS